ncbi:MAG: hypothetical protein WDO18_07585 [Acidobacteriota bacterium]
MPRHAAPADLTRRLRTVAARERVYRTPWARMRARCLEVSKNWSLRAHLMFDNVMRPLAVPVAGGVFSAVTLFSLGVAPAYPVISHTMRSVQTDVPTKLMTEARGKDVSMNVLVQSGLVKTGDILLEVVVDDNGYMVDYSIVNDTPLSADTRRRLEGNLVGARFTPATSFGRPTAGRFRLWISSIDVKG